MRLLAANSVSFHRGEELRARKAALLLLCNPQSVDSACLSNLSAKAWRRLLHWLDTSGLALYLLEGLIELRQTHLAPPEVLALLHRRLEDNIARTKRMIAEAAELHRAFQGADLCYATLKGFSLWPHSVPKPELRSQLDLDFLVAEESAAEARRILEERGYHLRAISGRSWEFKTLERPGKSLHQLYKNDTCRSAELHIESRNNREISPLEEKQSLCFCGISMPVLSPVDLFLGQGLHLFKHVCSEFSRLAHWVEFRRHVMARQNDLAFWHALKARSKANPRASTAVGVVILLITRVTGEFAPDALTSWTVDCLPGGARRWVETYGERAAYMSFPGNKLYLLLQKELAGSGFRTNRSLCRALLPVRLPPAVFHAPAQEAIADKIRRYRMQTWFVWFRFRFHAVHGFGYACESIRWRMYTAGVSR